VAPTLVEDGPKEIRILRADYEQVIKEGLQPIMRWYLTMPAYDASEKFLGFRIVRILKTELKDGPVKVGDVLRRINGRPIETPGQVEAVWRELWSRKTLTLTMIREDRPLDLTIPIVSPDAETAPTN
jgi:type II secretory pathway component PulC